MTPKDLCMQLLHIDNEKEVISLLKLSGYWDDPKAWREFGDTENNYSTAGAQQSDATAAFVEKLINSIDARLMNAILSKGINPESTLAPKTVPEAVAKFLITGDKYGSLSNWTDKELSEHASKITVAATGTKRNPSFTIVDQGEGQTPAKVPYTFMSLNRSNKLKIPFVQGKFNMGGTGVFRFCGDFSLQLLITRRNPALVNSENIDDQKWSFTVVKRDPPIGMERSSVFRYLAPLQCKKGKNGVLRFYANELPLFPHKDKPYVTDTSFGSLVKLYNYKAKGKTHILLGGGLKNAVDVRLPNPALPVRFHECRHKAYKRSASNQILVGLLTKLENRSDSQLEDGFPIGVKLVVEKQTFDVKVYGFRENKAKSYFSASDGVLFTVNGQTHGNLTRQFFKGNKVNLGYIADSILVHIDCSKLTSIHQEALFMNSRDRLADSTFRRSLEDELVQYLNHEQKIHRFSEQRRRNQLNEKYVSEKTLEKIVQELVQKSPSLAEILTKGSRIQSPKFHNIVDIVFEGKEFPTKFHFKGKKKGYILKRSFRSGQTVHLTFETDVVNNYFLNEQKEAKVEVELHVETPANKIILEPKRISLAEGISTISIELPNSLVIGEIVNMHISISDVKNVYLFENNVEFKVIEALDGQKPKGEKPSKPSSYNLNLPRFDWIKKEEWDDYKFDKYSALTAVATNTSEGTIYDFYGNEDNVHLQNELMKSKKNSLLLKQQYKIAMILIGMGIIQNEKDSSNDVNLGDLIFSTTKSISMMLIPILRDIPNIDHSSLDDEEK